MNKKIAKLFILGAIASLFFRKGFMTPASIMPFEIFIWIAVIFTLPILRIKEISYYLKLFALFILFTLIGLLHAYIYYNNFTPEIIRGLILDYYFLASSMLGFLLIIYYGREKKFLKYALLAFLSSLFLSSFLVLENSNSHFSPFITDFRLIGFHTGPTILASLLIIPLAILLSYLILSRKKIISGIGITLILALIFWTGTRASWLAIFFMMIFIFFYYIRKSKNKIKFTANLILWSIVIASIAFIIIPREAQNMIFIRIYPHYIEDLYVKKEIVETTEVVSEKLLTRVSTISLPGITQKNIVGVIKDSYAKKDKKFIPSLPHEDRQIILPKSLKVFMLHPFGLGLQFYRIQQQILVNDLPAGAHSTFLTTLLIGGPGALIIILFLLYKTLKSLIVIKNRNTYWLSICLSLIGLIVVLIFDDRLTYPWFWIIPALAIAWPEKSD